MSKDDKAQEDSSQHDVDACSQGERISNVVRTLGGQVGHERIRGPPIIGFKTQATFQLIELRAQNEIFTNRDVDQVLSSI